MTDATHRTAVAMQARTAPQALKIGLTGPARMGALASLTLLLVAFFWLKYTLISGAVIASGQVVVPGKPKMVQTLDGGVVSEILVTEGQRVEAGQVLLRFDPTLLQINLDIYRGRLAEVVARQNRLEAEYAGADTVGEPDIPPQLAGMDMAHHLAGQREIFEARQEVLAGKHEQLQERVLQFRNQITGTEGRINATQEQVGYVERELGNMQSLAKQGLVRESQVLELQRNQSELLGAQAEATAELARIRNSIRDTELEILQTNRQFKEDVVTELRETTAARDELILQIVTIQKQLDRIDILAPVDGIIHEMQVFTVGGVVAPEGTILEVVPVGSGIEFELRIDPRSIDQIFAGQKARVVFPAFDLRAVPEIFGTVKTVSPTSIADPQTQQSYFRLTLEVPPDQLALLGDVELIPGMPVEAFLQTGERSVLNYLTKPLIDQLDRAFRDG